MTNSNLIELYRKLRPLQIFPTSASSTPRRPSLSVLTYNLLSQHHINSEVYPYCAAGVLRSAYRRSHLVAELQAYGPFDIAAFQEVGQFDEFWRHQWEKERKQSFFAAKEGGRDGLCIVFDSGKFQAVSEEAISFAPLMTALEAVPNIAQILLLKPSDTNDNCLIIVSNTHLFWRPDFDCLRVLQAHHLRKRLEEIKAAQSTEIHSIIVMCGDWNSDPKSAVYHLLSGQLDKISRLHWNELIQDHSRLLQHSPDESQKLFSQVLEDFKKWSKLTSAYSLHQSPSDPSIRSEPAYTSINSYVDTLDYIFTDFDKVGVSELLMMPADEIVRGQTALPNEIYSSDHLALMAKFHFK